MARLEEWRIKEIGLLIVEAAEIQLTKEERHKLFFEISLTISLFGLYETCKEVLKEKIEKFKERR